MARCIDCLHFEVCKQRMEELCKWTKVEDLIHNCSKFKDRTSCVEVVRCKDCKYSRTTQWYRSSLKCCHKSHGNSQVPYEVPKEHFCSYGERRETDE